ncbi:MAG: DNA polymerase III subunit gamma/tau [Phycisphaerales bacterium]|nr:MAG: DNA polymerase III subunit gamma/tau [Phycisphaerales bacterium]
MSYMVLARKYRSRDFDEIVGQPAIATTLRQAIASGRIHHAYLFTGTRGVGKTSMARILAKALNCLEADGPTDKPCAHCEACLAIAEGEDIDVVEIDAASNTGVDNIRELIANANYRPARARFKVYIIDEVHMLSTGAFNALLKILEEPPEHVKFILATTEPQKVPATILSRVQRFDFRSISVDDIAAQLVHILEAEKLSADESVVRRVARQAGGSMRDALSLLDQLLSLGGDRLTPELVDEILPVTYREDLGKLIDAAADEDAGAALRLLDEVLAQGFTLERFCETLIEQLRSLMLLRVCGPHTDLADVPTGVRDQATKQAARFEPTQYVYMISLLEELRRNIRYNGAARALTDAAVVRLSQVGRFRDITELLGRADRAPRGTARARPGTAKKKPDLRTAPARGDTVTSPSRASNPAKVVPPARPRASNAELAEARAEPLVQYAVELFDGVLSNVEPVAQATVPMVRPEDEDELETS